jgi:hypothetical protein
MHVLDEQRPRWQDTTYRAAIWPRDIREVHRRAEELERQRRQSEENAERQRREAAERWRRANIEYQAQEMAKQKPPPPADEIERWLAWNNGTVRILASTIREHWQDDVFPILADALEEAGCTSTELIETCRRGSPEIACRWILLVLLEPICCRVAPCTSPNPAT